MQIQGHILDLRNLKFRVEPRNLCFDEACW